MNDASNISDATAQDTAKTLEAAQDGVTREQQVADAGVATLVEAAHDTGISTLTGDIGIGVASNKPQVKTEVRPVGYFDRLARALVDDEHKIMGEARGAANNLLHHITSLGVSRELSIARTKLEEAMHFVEAHFKVN